MASLALALLYPLAERYMTVARTLSGWRYRLGPLDELNREWPPELASILVVLLLGVSLLWAVPHLKSRWDARILAIAALSWIGLWLWAPQSGPAYWLLPWWQLALLLLWFSWLPGRHWSRALSRRLIARLHGHE